MRPFLRVSHFAVAVLLSAGFAVPAAVSVQEQEKPGPAEAKVELAPEPININKATVADLVKLPGIGEVIAGRIVRHRKIVGPFRKIEELLVIPGISRRRFEKLRKLVTVGVEREEGKRSRRDGPE